MKTRIWQTAWFRIIAGTLISIFFVYLAVRDVPLAQVASALAGANYTWVLIAVLLVVLQSWLRAVRWILLFYPQHTGLRIRQMFGIGVIAQMLNIVAPWRLGDLVRIYLTGEIEKRPAALTLATLGTEKIFDTLMLLLMILAVPLYITLPSELEGPRQGFIYVSVILFAGALALILFGDRALSLLMKIPLGWLQRMLETHGEDALAALGVFRQRDLQVKLLALSVAVTILGVVVNQMALLALQVQLPLLVPFLLFPVLQIGGVVPSSPGKIGLFQYLCILTLGLFAVDSSIGLAYGILLYVIAYGTPMVLGVAILWWGGISLKSAASIRAEVEGSR